MEQPFHSMRSVQSKPFTPQRALGLLLAVALQAGFVLAIMSGLAGSLIQKLPDELKVAVEQEKTPPKTPPPPPPKLETPPPPFVPPPEIVIQQEAAPTNTITTQSVVKVAPPPIAAPAPPKPTELHAITRTHSLPPYPELSVKLGEEGTTTMKVSISTEGNVTTCDVQKSSGSTRLDAAACQYVQARWRWQPPTQNGQPTAVSTLVAVTWSLKNAR